MNRPWCVDLFCGRGGVTRAFLAAGYRVTGVDIDRHKDYPEDADFIQADMRDVDGSQFRGCYFMWASPPCTEFSRWGMPWTRRTATEPSLALVQAAYRIREQAQPTVFILENVQSAQRWLGQANLQRAGRYLWGDAALAPRVEAKSKESYSSARADLRSEIPWDLAYGLATLYKPSALTPNAPGTGV